MTSKAPAISVIVCSYNGARKLKKCLDAIRNQSIKEEFEVIVVNDGSRDGTDAILATYKDLTIINNISNQGLAASRNIGSNKARANLLAYTDDDCIADKHWLKNLVSSYSDSNIDGVGGKIIPYKIDHWLLKYYSYNNPLAHLGIELRQSDSITYRFYLYLIRNLRLNRLADRPLELYSIVGANMSMRKSVYQNIGGFNPKFRFGGDEEEFWSRYYEQKTDKKLIYNPAALIRHDYIAKFNDAIRRNYLYGVGNARQALTHKSRPVIYPFPFLVITFLIAITIANINMVWLIPILVAILYPGWLVLAFTKLNPFLILYAYLQTALEMTTNVGVTAGFLRYLKQSSRGIAQ